MATQKEPAGWRRWLWLSPEEAMVVGGILAIALVGLLARHLHLRSQTAEDAEPPAVEAVQSYQ